MNEEKGFAPLIIAIIAVIVLALGAGGYVFIAKKNSAAPEYGGSGSLPGGLEETPAELLGWWEEVESWSLDFQTGKLKKDETAFPFMREFTDNYFCTQYSSKSTCANNIRYSVNKNKILLEGAPEYYEWNIADGRLGLVSKDAKGRVFNKSISKKIGPPTSQDKITAPASTRPGLAENPKPVLKLIKFGPSGICLKHEGGDSISVTRLGFEINDQSTSMLSLEQFPKLTDYIFDPGEFFVFAIQPIAPERFQVFHTGDKVEIIDSGNIIAGPWVVDKIVEESAPVLIGGLASCP